MSNNVLERTFRFMFKANKCKQGVKGALEFIPRAICYGRKNIGRPSKLVIFLEVYCQFDTAAEEMMASFPFWIKKQEIFIQCGYLGKCYYAKVL
ncbi:hypothetical protein CEXT_165231 [Caerostris extrusa]|uniref:Transposase n=1 Tax=Caerostris extrusa TaxID=172846 RepID=A0AAV4XSJ5_CAEEX|nr:hypothetical protein CEXT_165231 [Caerostris extrusa]